MRPQFAADVASGAGHEHGPGHKFFPFLLEYGEFSQNVGGTQNLKSSLLVCACSHYCPILVGAPAAIALPSPSHRFARRTVPDGLFRRSYHLQVHICWNTRELCYLQMVQTETHV